MVGRPGTRSSQNSPNRSERTQGVGSVDKVYCVYTLTNQRNAVLDTGVTGNLGARVNQHREKLLPGFTNRYNVSSSSIMRRDTMRPGPLNGKNRFRQAHAAEEDQPDQRVQS